MITFKAARIAYDILSKEDPVALDNAV